MWENPRRGQDKVIVKALINLLGIYPVGTCVILDSYEVGVVHAANPDPVHLHRPLVRIVFTPLNSTTPTDVTNGSDLLVTLTFKNGVV